MPTQAELIALLTARVEKLELMLGLPFADRPITQADLTSANEIPGSGRYPWIISDWQLHTALDSLANAGPVPSPVPTPGTQIPGSFLVEGDLVVKGKIVSNPFGFVHPDALAQLQIFGKQDAAILKVSNMSGGQYQGAGTHYAEDSLDADGGHRRKENQYLSTITTPVFDPVANLHYDSNMREYVEPSRPQLTWGPDRNMGISAKWGKSPTTPVEYTQHLVIRPWWEKKLIQFQSFMSGWRIVFTESTGFITLDRWFRPVKEDVSISQNGEGPL